VNLTRTGQQLRRVAKRPYHVVRRRQAGPPRVLFILGCQRSGTTLLTRIFDHDWQAKVYDENSALSSRDVPKQLRLNPLPEVASMFADDRASLIVAKPLVERQNAVQLLDAIENSRAIWLYRHFEDAAASHVQKWGPGHSMRNLRSIVEAVPHDWRNE
jgi:hypothetical protein